MTRVGRRPILLLFLVSALLLGCSEQERSTPTPVVSKTRSNIGIFGGNPQRTGFYANGGSPQLSVVLWEYSAGKLASMSWPIVANGKVYTMVSNEGSHPVVEGLHELDAETGKLISTRSAESGLTPTVISNTLYYGDKDGFHSMNVSAGADSQNFALDRKTSGSSPVVSDGSLFFHNDRGSFFAFDAVTGRQKWEFDAGYSFGSDAAIADGMIYFNSDIEAFITGPDAHRQNHLYALDQYTGRRVWTFDPAIDPPRFLADPMVINGIVYCASFSDIGSPNDQEYVFALDGKTGKLLWTYKPTGGWGYKSLDLAGDGSHIYVATSNFHDDAIPNDANYTSDGVLFALDAKSGGVLWTFKMGTDLFYPAVAGSTVYAVGYDNNKKENDIYALDTQGGQVIRKFSYGKRIASPLAIDDSIIYFIADNYDEPLTAENPLQDTLVAVR